MKIVGSPKSESATAFLEEWWECTTCGVRVELDLSDVRFVHGYRRHVFMRDTIRFVCPNCHIVRVFKAWDPYAGLMG